MPPHHYNINSHEDLKNVVSWLKELTGGVPVSLKFCASKIKEDIDVALYAGVDDLHKLDKSHMYSLDDLTGKITGVKLIYGL